LRLLLAAGRLREAEEQRELSARLLGETGAAAVLELARAWRSLVDRPEGEDLARGLPSAESGAWPARAAEGSPNEEGPSPAGTPVPRAGRAAESGRRRIAILPFTNMSGDAEHEYFADGVTEDIITDLSQVSALFVVARNTAFTYKGKAVEVTGLPNG
jgi:adenylate cyclase